MQEAGDQAVVVGAGFGGGFRGFGGAGTAAAVGLRGAAGGVAAGNFAVCGGFAALVLAFGGGFRYNISVAVPV